LAAGQLFDNACRYAPAGSAVKAGLEFAGNSAALTVWNCGPAIPVGEAAHIFERFYRGEDARRLSSGTGLGLYVARKIAVAHGGRLELEAPEVRAGGVAFRLTIPAGGEEEERERPAASRSHRGLRSALRRALRTSLAATGFAVEEARNGDEAREAFGERRSDLVMLDINVPGLSGVETCRRLRALDREAGIVMVTVRDSEAAWYRRWKPAPTIT
jgi:hypothetical protein